MKVKKTTMISLTVLLLLTLVTALLMIKRNAEIVETLGDVARKPVGIGHYFRHGEHVRAFKSHPARHYKPYIAAAKNDNAFADKIGADKFIYSGASHGSGVGWHLCLRHPERLVCFFASVAGPLSPEGIPNRGSA